MIAPGHYAARTDVPPERSRAEIESALRRYGATKFGYIEDEFLAHTVLPNGRTVAEETLPRIAEAYRSGRDIPLLPGPGEDR